MWNMRFACLVLGAGLASALTLNKREAAVVSNLRDNCFPRPGSEGCRCTSKDKDGAEQVTVYDTDDECKTVLKTVENKAKLNEEFKKTFGGLREGCFPRPKKGCRCQEKDAAGNEVTKLYNSTEECGGPSVAAKNAKAKLNEEFAKQYGGLKDNCFPRPGRGCRCAEKDASGNEVTNLYDTDAQCKVELVEGCTETECKLRDKRDLQQRERSQSPSRPSQNVRDPVREKAQANYQAVINELKDKFRGLKEGCFPRPKGCMCVIGKDVDGREITERRMKDADCKCQPGETGPDCPAPAA